MLVKFTKDEIKHLLLSFIAVTIIFSIHLTNKYHWSTNEFITVLPLTLIVFVISLILRTFIQKKIALDYRYTIQYKLYSYGLIFSIITMIFNIIVLIPSYIDYGLYERMISDNEKYKISLVGPVFNIILAVIFMIILLIIKPYFSLNIVDINFYIMLAAIIGFNVNSYMSFFNLIPFVVTDGLNLFNYKTSVWIILIVLSGILSVLSFTNYLL
ncbi:MAG: hypothetical protein E7Z86_00210 [Methanosphaera stadtmanae]|nr:hypothetical protein [Methanosphaera stadtmanae]